MVQAFLNQMGECGNLRTGGPLSSKSVKNIRVVLDVCCKRAVADGHMKENPVPGTVCRRCPSRTVEVLSDEQQKVLEGWLFENLPCTAPDLCWCCTADAPGECCALRWSCYDPARGEAHRETVRRVTEDLPGTQEKKPRLVYSDRKPTPPAGPLALADILLDLLDFQYQRFTDTFGRAPAKRTLSSITKRAGAMDPDNLSSLLWGCAGRTGLPHVKYHAMRHTFATRAIENGVDVATLPGCWAMRT